MNIKFLNKKQLKISRVNIQLFSYINYCIIKRNAKSVRTSEAQENWRKVYNNGYSGESGNLLWRIKPMLFPRVKVEIFKRIKAIRWFNVFILIVLSKSLKEGFNPMIIPFIAINITDILYFIDMFLGLYTETEGTCTGVVRKEISKSKTIYYEIYVSDFAKKRELVFRQYDYYTVSEMDTVIVTHGCFSKRVIDTKIIKR